MRKTRTTAAPRQDDEGAPENNQDGGRSESRHPEHRGRGHALHEYRYKPGQSGNPNGRPKGRHRVETQVHKLLKKPVTLKDGRVIARAELVVRAIDSGLMQGNLKAIDYLIELEERYSRTRSGNDQFEMTERRQQALAAAMQRLATEEPEPEEEEHEPPPGEDEE